MTTNIHTGYGYGNPDSASGHTIGLDTTDFYDVRGTVSSADGSAIQEYVATSGGQVIDCIYGIAGVAGAGSGTVSAGKYVVSWTEGGAAMGSSVSISAVGANASSSVAIFPDNGSTITVQLSALTGGGAVNVRAVFSRVF